MLIAAQILGHAQLKRALHELQFIRQWLAKTQSDLEVIAQDACRVYALGNERGMGTTYRDIARHRRRSFMASPYYRRVSPIVARYNAIHRRATSTANAPNITHGVDTTHMQRPFKQVVDFGLFFNSDCPLTS
jgi:hypothetical protein